MTSKNNTHSCRPASFTAIFEAKTYPYPTSNPIPQIISGDSGAQSTLTQSFGSSSGWMYALESYWQNRSIANGHGNFSSKETGVSNTSALQLRSTVVENAISNNSGGLANDPGLYSSIPAPPAIQSIATLNVTSQSTLDLLLASLLTNTTNGINGTLQSVTNFASGLSLDPAVLSAIANAPAGGAGVYGPPGYNVQTPSPGGPWSDFVNGATSIATTVAGAVVSLEGVIYTAGVDAFTYFNHLATEACAIGAFLCKPLTRVAATLVSVGKAIASALASLFNYILSLVKAALAVVVDPIVNDAKAYFIGLNTSYTSAYDEVLGDHPVSTAQANSWWNALGGSLFQGSTGLGVALEIALTLLSPLTLGASFLVSVVIPMIVSANLQSLAGTVPLVGSLTSVTGWSSAAISMVWSVMNSTLGASRVPSALLGTYFQLGVADLGAFSLAWQILFASKAGGLAGLEVLGPVAVVILAVLSLTADIVGKALGSTSIDWMGVLSGAIGSGLGIYTTLNEDDPSLKVLTGLGAVLSGFGCLVGVAMVE